VFQQPGSSQIVGITLSLSNTALCTQLPPLPSGVSGLGRPALETFDPSSRVRRVSSQFPGNSAIWDLHCTYCCFTVRSPSERSRAVVHTSVIAASVKVHREIVVVLRELCTFVSLNNPLSLPIPVVTVVIVVAIVLLDVAHLQKESHLRFRQHER
jgi:hypothetical protein